MSASKPNHIKAPLRVGIIGAGQMARHHARAISTLHSASLSAIADPDAAATAVVKSEHPKVRVFASAADLIASRAVDVVHICTPPSTHESLTETALAAGCHVYVEKPFVETTHAALRLARLADEMELKICAGHQLLYEPPTRAAVKLLPALGELTHVESYFSFRAMKHSPSGRPPLRDDLQLLDILPHPVYLLLDFLERATEGKTELTAVDVGPKGTVHALVRRGSLTGTLVVTLEGRPVDSYLRLVGTNGSVHADYVRSTVQTSIGPGASGIDKLLAPYSHARQLVFGTNSAMAKRFLRKQKSYPGLAEIFSAFYESIQSGTPSPVSRSNLIGTVELCERVGHALAAAYPTPVAKPPARQHHRAPVVVTGGTGFLGKEVVRALLARGEAVRVVSRRAPTGWDAIPGVSYVAADIAESIAPEVMHGAKAIVHCAAETAGGWEQHERNSVKATEHVLAAASTAGIRKFIHVSTISVLSVPRRGELLSEETPLERNARSAGPYAWGKSESEKIVVERGRELGIDTRIVRPSALVDYRNFDPPGLLGKRLGNIFIAVGMPYHKLGVVDLVFAARTIAWMIANFDDAPPVLNLFDPKLPTKQELIVRLRQSNPDLSVVWLMPAVLVPLSWMAIALQKLLRPTKPAINVAKVFARLRYDTRHISALAPDVSVEPVIKPVVPSAALFRSGAGSSSVERQLA